MRRVDGILASGTFILGPWGKRLEERIAKLCGTKHAIACASGTDALILSLKAIGVGPAPRSSFRPSRSSRAPAR